MILTVLPWFLIGLSAPVLATAAVVVCHIRTQARWHWLLTLSAYACFCWLWIAFLLPSTVSTNATTDTQRALFWGLMAGPAVGGVWLIFHLLRDRSRTPVGFPVVPPSDALSKDEQR